MPDLIFRRRSPTPVKMVCMYCGGPATHVRERRIKNPRIDPRAGGADHGLTDFPRGDDPVAGCIALVLLPFVLVGLGQQLRGAWRHRAAAKAAPPLDPPHTVVTITTCDRHRHSGRRFVWVAVAVLLALAAAWAATILLGRDPAGPPEWVVGGTVVATVAAPIIFLLVWAFDAPVRVTAVTRDTVTLSDVREAYFNARD